MPFCANCGSSLEGPFCIRCGKPAGQAAEAPPAPSSRKKTSPLVWVLVAIVGVFALFGIAIVAGGFFIAHKAVQAGLDPDSMRRNPGVAIARFVAATHPDLELVSVDESSNRVTLRRKETGKYITLDLRDVKNGKLLLDVEGEGTVTVGGEAHLPEWVPDYPGSKPQAAITGEGKRNEGGMIHFTTADPPRDVLDFYGRELKDTGFEIESRMGGDSGHAGGGMLSAKDSQGRKVAVMLGGEGSATKVTVTYALK